MKNKKKMAKQQKAIELFFQFYYYLLPVFLFVFVFCLCFFSLFLFVFVILYLFFFSRFLKKAGIFTSDGVGVGVVSGVVKCNGIGVRRMRTFPFLPTPLMTPLLTLRFMI